MRGRHRRDDHLIEENYVAHSLHSRACVHGSSHIALPGAHVSSDHTSFVVYATEAREVAIRLYVDATRGGQTLRLESWGDGVFARNIAGVREGALYKVVLDGDEVPDPYARYLPFGVHGPARVVAPAHEPALELTPSPHQWSIYELHVGTFSPEGTYRGAIEKLDALVDLGITAIELLPVAAFAGARGWGYDGVALFAPFAAYGEPDDLRALVRAAHARGIAVILDVVYNHFGPTGNYLPRYAKSYFTEDVQTPWGPAPDFARRPMRQLVLENVRYWLADYGFDALRLDATHAIVDPSDRHILSEIVDVASSIGQKRRIFLEDERNLPSVVQTSGADALWADDLHHQLHVLLTKERDGYYEAYEPKVEALANCIRQGWSYSGQPYAPWEGRPRGAPATSLRPEQLVVCIQNHDQVGNRAFGTRLSHDAGVDRFALATMVLLFLPMTPLLFMGQEWAATSPFLFFSDHEGELGQAVTNGRRKEFAAFAAFRNAALSEKIPDPQARETFDRSKLRWEERAAEPHRRVLALHGVMLRLRREDPVLSAPSRWDQFDALARGEILEVVRRHAPGMRHLVVNFSDQHCSCTAPDGARTLATWGSVDGHRLGPLSAVIFAAD
jgi:maltooligosyltrehalose trehalohydrolase